MAKKKVSHRPFTLRILQAINDWQRGGDPKQVRRRGKALQDACARLPKRFRECHLICFRQIALEKGSVWNIVVEEALAEKISAWTSNSAVAKAFKGGVPPDGQGYQGVIVQYMPTPKSVIMNLVTVYADPRFQQACERWRPKILSFGDGIGRYGANQCEVVLEVDTITKNDLYAVGGHSSAFDRLVEQAAELIYGRPATPEEFRVLMLQVEPLRECAGPAWLGPEATKRVLKKLAPHAELLGAIKRLQSSMTRSDTVPSASTRA